ncbi:MAG: hypothetical protein D6815_01210 [Candidatus Dadabacteria bacterium]|nr:MAG: hypothetical protein D6815_01210 [Candidatus Dadabacteria bacterium]
MLLAGCATLVIDSSDIEVEAVEYGLFEPAEEAFRHVETRIDIACEPGTIFGVGYRLIFRHGAHGRLPLEFSVHQPTPTSGLTAPADGPSVLHVEPTVPRGARFGDVQVLEIIDGQNALHSGRYEFVVRVPEKDVVLDKRSFVLSGCENPADAGPGR